MSQKEITNKVTIDKTKDFTRKELRDIEKMRRRKSPIRRPNGKSTIRHYHLGPREVAMAFAAKAEDKRKAAKASKLKVESATAPKV